MTPAERAVTHIIDRALSDPRFGYYVGYGTRTLELLAAAHAEMYNRPVEEVKRGLEDAIRTERPSCSECPHCRPDTILTDSLGPTGRAAMKEI